MNRIVQFKKNKMMNKLWSAVKWWCDQKNKTKTTSLVDIKLC